MAVEPNGCFKNGGLWRWIVLATAAAYVALAIASSLAKRPWSDEGWFASAPFNLVTKGWMGTTVVEQAGHPFLEGIDCYTYWVMPLHLIVQAGWASCLAIVLWWPVA